MQKRQIKIEAYDTPVTDAQAVATLLAGVPGITNENEAELTQPGFWQVYDEDALSDHWIANDGIILRLVTVVGIPPELSEEVRRLFYDGTKGGSGFGLEVVASLVAYASGAAPPDGPQHCSAPMSWQAET